jgi:hypothetical protein
MIGPPPCSNLHWHPETVDEYPQNPTTTFHHGLSDVVLSEFVERRKKAVTGASDERRAILVLENCLHRSSVWNNKDMQSLFMNGRHLRTGLLISMQYPMTIPKSLCAIIDYIFLFRDGSCRKRVYESYARMFPSQAVFDDTMNEYTSDHGCLVMIKSMGGDRLEDNVFWYKASFAPIQEILAH